MKQDASHEKQLHAAQEALSMLERPIRLGPRGEIDGLYDADVGMDAMASALASLFAFPDAGEDHAPELSEVLAYLQSIGQTETTAPALADGLKAKILLSGYGGLPADEIDAAEKLRKDLHQLLVELLGRPREVAHE
jgi:hypothetical protein